jgi:undecaprenyl-diphosphatase
MSHLVQSIILGLTQGLTEFLPISSSGHLVLVGKIFHLSDASAFFDALLHLATLLAVVVYFWHDIVNLFKPEPKQRKLLWQLVVATIPAAVFGLLLTKFFESFFQQPIIVAALMLFTAVVLIVFERLSRPKIGLDKIKTTQSLGIGLAQALAILPGVSRLGLTLSTGLFYGLKREDAARFTFLLSVPVIFGAGLLAVWDTIKTHALIFNLDLLMAAGIAFVAAIMVIAFLMRYIKNRSLIPFAVYLILVGGSFIIYQLFFA